MASKRFWLWRPLELENALTKSDNSTNGLAEPHKQPFMWITPIIARISEGSLFYDFEIIIGDLVKKDESNELDVESDTMLICLDVLSKLDDESYDWALSKQSNLQPFTEKWDSEFSGHIMNISLEFMFDYNYCQAPITPKDSDLTVFLSKTGIEDENQIFALNYLITELKNNNLWDKMHVIYPFVGETAYRHSFNLKKPNQNQIDWYGGVIHDNIGISGDGINGYGNTNYIIPPENQDNFHLSLYHRNNINTGMAIGVIEASTRGTILIPSSVNIYAGRINQIGGGEISNEDTENSDAYYVVNRLNNTTVTNYKDNILFFSDTYASNTPPSLPLYVLGRNLNGTADYFSQSNVSLITLGDGLLADEITSLTSINKNFQTYLNRNI